MMSENMIEQPGATPNQVVHIRSDSADKLDELFDAVIHPKDNQVPLTVPMRLRNLPPSFFQQPSHSRESSVDKGCGSPSYSPLGLPIKHPRAHSSPASLQQGCGGYSKPPLPPQHPRQRSFGDLLDDPPPLPPGWEMAKTTAGQTYFLNHLTKTTTWVDPRKKQPSPIDGMGSPPPVTLASFPNGWEQATTEEGEVYFINHLDRSTSWLDPRIPAHLQSQPSVSAPTHQQQSVPTLPPHNPAQVPGGLVRPPVQFSAGSQPMKLPPLPPVQTNSLQQQSLRVQSLEMEREQLRLRQQEIMRQQELLLRQSLGEKLTLAVSPDMDSFLEGTTDFHSRQESADSGLGLGSNYSLPHTPEDFLSNLDDIEDRQSNDLGLDLQNTLDLGDDNMDTDDLVPSLQEALNADILSDVEALLAANKDSVLTWL